MISDEMLLISQPPPQAYLQSMAKTQTPGWRGTSALHREFRGRKVFAPTLPLTLGFEPWSLWLTSLHCYCGDKGYLCLGDLHRYIYTVHWENTRSRLPRAASSKPSLKNYQNNYPIFLEIIKLLQWQQQTSRDQTEENILQERNSKSVLHLIQLLVSPFPSVPCPDSLSAL